MRIAVTGLARAGKTAFLTSLAANLLAAGAGLPCLPALSRRLAGRRFEVAVAPAGASEVPRFDYLGNLACLAADPPSWPARTEAVSLLSLDLTIGRAGLLDALPPRRIRLDCLDYPGEWLLDLPLLAQDFAAWSQATLQRLAPQADARAFLAFAEALPSRAAADEALAASGHRLYLDALQKLRGAGLSFLQPGRFLMPAPGPLPPWLAFFPTLAQGGLGDLLAQRYDAYRAAVRRDLEGPLFGSVDRLVVLADLLSALHAGPAAYADAAAALTAAADALRWRRSWLTTIPGLGDLLALWPLGPLPAWLGGGISRVAYAATKADHIAERQRGNLATLVGRLVAPSGADSLPGTAMALAALRCTEDFVWTLDGRPVSAVRGRVLGEARITRSYPGEVPDRPPEPGFWAHRFLALPQFEPLVLPAGGRAGVPHIGLDTLVDFLLEDVL